MKRRIGKVMAAFLLLASVLLPKLNFGQDTIRISQGGSVAVKKGDLFYDAGGPSGSDGSTNYTITLTPVVAGEAICIDFTYFKSKGTLDIYDGTSTSATNIGTLIGDYSIDFNNASTSPYGTGQKNIGSMPDVLSPGIFCANNASGALTLEFKGGGSSPGWVGLITTYAKVNIGCTVDITANPTTACIGSAISLKTKGLLGVPVLNNDFNASNIGAGWTSNTSITFLSVLSCEPNRIYTTKNSDSSTYVWMQSAAAPRYLETNAFDVPNGGYLSFDYRQASDDNGGNGCEAPDDGEGTYVQYSKDGGATWLNLKLMFPGVESAYPAAAYIGCGPYVYQWNTTTIPIPDAAKSANTKFRWYQNSATSSTQDNWGLDNVKITKYAAATLTITDLSNNSVVVSTTKMDTIVNVYPTTSRSYRVTLSDGGANSCTKDVAVTINSCGCVPPTITTEPSAQTTCSGKNTSFSVSATGGTGYQWQVNSGSSWANVTNGGVYSGATTATLAITGAQAALNNAQYKCIIQGSATGCPDTTVVAVLTVTTAANPTYSKTSTDVTCAGLNTGTITLAAVSPNTTFNWVSGPITSPIPAGNKPAGATDERALVNIPAGTYCVDITRVPSGIADTARKTLFTEEFETGATAWTIDNSTGPNIFVINNAYVGGTCVSGTGNFTIPNTPNQPAAIPGNPASSYLHIKSTTTTGVTCSGASTNFIPNNANFDAQVSDQKVTLNTPIVTTGLFNVKFKFYWLAKGDASGNDYGAIEYSTNGGSTWTQAGSKLNLKGTAWNNDSISVAAWNNQPSLRFRIRWVNNASSTLDPPLAIDHIVITADTATPASSCSATLQECFTIGSPSCCVSPVISTQPSPAFVCAGEDTSFVVVATGATAGYQWQVNTGSGWVNVTNGVNYSGATTATLSVIAPIAGMNNYQYRCVVKETIGACPTTSEVVTLTLKSTVATLSNLTTGGATVSGFASGTYTYNVTLPYGTTVVPAVTATTTAATATKVVTPATSLPGSTTVVVTAQDGTTKLTYTIDYTLAIQTHDVAFNVVGSNGTLTATVDGNDVTSPATVQQGKSMVFTATPTANFMVKEWILAGVVVSGNTSNNYTLSNVTADSTVAVEFTSSTSVEENNERLLSLYPNPANDRLTVKLNAPIHKISVVNLNGQVVLETWINKNEGVVNTSKLSNGLYFLRIETANGVMMEKIQISK